MIYDFLTRFHTHRTQTIPIIEHYQKLGLVRKIQASKSPDEVRPSNMIFRKYVVIITIYFIGHTIYKKYIIQLL